MADRQDFLDNLENLRLVMSVALEHMHENRDRLVKNATNEEIKHADRSIGSIRSLAARLGEELNVLEHALAKATCDPQGKRPC